jgi:hypothetical protein
MKPSGKNKFIFIIAVGLAVCAAIAAVVLNVSETTMVALSYLIVPLLVFGTVGLSVAKDNINGALAIAGVSLMALFVFLVAIFPML